MCGGGGGDGGASEREEERQAAIAAGLENINRIFDGYQQGINPVLRDDVSEGGEYYTRDGQYATLSEVDLPIAATPKTGGGINGIVTKAGTALAGDSLTNPRGLGLVDRDGNLISAYNGQQLFSGSEQVGGFDDDFFNQREQSYLDFALPQLEDQFEEQQDDLLFSLARNNRLNSQTRAESLADLQKQYDLQRTNINDDALSVANNARSAIESARSDLVLQNNSLADPTAVASLASQRANTLSQSESFDPLGTLFQNSTAGLATAQQANAARTELENLSTIFSSGGSSNSRIVGG